MDAKNMTTENEKYNVFPNTTKRSNPLGFFTMFYMMPFQKYQNNRKSYT